MSQAGILNIEYSILPPDVPLVFVTDSGDAIAVGNVIQILGGARVTTSAPGSSNIIQINVAAGAFSWNVVTSADNPVMLTNENGYIAKGASPVNFVLPAAAAIGDTFKILGYGNLWTIAQNAGQSITIGFLTSTAGVGGSVSATMISDSLEIVCVTTNLEFYESDIQGNLMIV